VLGSAGLQPPHRILVRVPASGSRHYWRWVSWVAVMALSGLRCQWLVSGVVSRVPQRPCCLPRLHPETPGDG